ncbi:MAG: AMP-binding protein [Chloroflexales bacterium]
MAEDNPALLYAVPFRYCLKQHRVARKNHTAIIDGLSGDAITYGELYDRVSRAAGWLTRTGVRQGDRVACLALNSKAYTEFFFALAWIGAVAVPLNIRLNPKELAFIIQDSGARAIFACGAMVTVAEAALADLPAVALRILNAPAKAGWVAYDELIRVENEPIDMVEAVSGDTLFMLLYTSGTTGKPKGCMIPQVSWTGYAVNMATCFGMGPQDVYLAFLPYFHVAGFGAACSQLILGGTVITVPLPDPKLFYRLIAQYRVSIMFLVPGISSAFVYEDVRKSTDTSSLRTFISGAGLEKLDLVNAVEEYLGAKYYGIYGQTESGSKITWADADMIRKDPTTYGQIMPFFAYRIVDDEDRELAPGRVGELCIRGQTVMQGYWNHPEATAETLKNGWHHTGDLFMLLENGQVKMVDRKKYLIKTGGENVYPQEVEQVLLRHDAIGDAAVVGIPDDTWGETVKAFVVLKEGKRLSRREIADWVGASIAAYKRPRFIEFVQTIPRNVSGKILKDDLTVRPTSEDQRV